MDANRYVQLTDVGLDRLRAVRRRFGTTVEAIVGDPDTPSANTVKRALRKGPVFVSTLERIWGYLQRCAAERRERLPQLVEGEDYVFVEVTTGTGERIKGENGRPDGAQKSRRGWISRQVPRPNRLFTGRRDVLDRVHAALTAGGPAALVADPQALTGLGGIGKTQAAIAYVYEHRNEYARVFWVNAETVQALNDGLASLAQELQLLDAAPATKDQALAKMHDWFRDESDWLLVLDNADDVAALAPHFPRHHAGRLLLTTRASNTARWAAPVPLAKFDREEGALLLLRRAGRLGVHQTLTGAPSHMAEEARELCDELDGLPLAINQAGAYLAETTSSVADYLTKYRRHGLRFLDRVEDHDHASVTITFTLALEQMAKRSVCGPAAVEMVRLCAFLAPDAIPDAIFTSPSRHERHSPPPPLPGVDRYDEICAAVCGYSLATRNPENRTLSVHRLVQRATQETLSPEERRAYTEGAVCAVAGATPDFEFEDWPLCDLLLPHWRLCADYISDAGIETAEAAYLLYQAGRYLRARAQYDEAEARLRKALALAETVHGPVHSVTADYLDELACLYREIDRAEDAEPLHALSLEITEKLEGPEHPETAARLHNMALFYSEQQRFARAEALFLRSLAIREKHAGRDELLTAATLTQLAGVYRYQGFLDKAEPHFRRALEIYESILEPHHIDIATSCNNLALLCVNTAQYGEAEALFLRALQINEQARGKEHPETGTVVWGLAWARWKQHRFAEADRLFRRALRIYTKSFGREHSKAARLLSHYAEFQKETGRGGKR